MFEYICVMSLIRELEVYYLIYNDKVIKIFLS